MKRAFLYVLIASLILVSCQKILFDSPEMTRQVQLKDFNAVRFHGIYNITLVQDSTNLLIINGKNHIRAIDVTVMNDTLIVDDHKKLSFNTNKNSLELHFTNLRYIETFDPVNLRNLDTLKADIFSLDAIGEIAEVNLSFNCNSIYIATSANTLGFQHYRGRADFLYIFTRYGSGFLADSLLCRKAEIYNGSIGDVRINVSDYLRAHIWGNGNIYYKGSPIVELAEKRGKGEIIKLN